MFEILNDLKFGGKLSRTKITKTVSSHDKPKDAYLKKLKMVTTLNDWKVWINQSDCLIPLF